MLYVLGIESGLDIPNLTRMQGLLQIFGVPIEQSDMGLTKSQFQVTSFIKAVSSLSLEPFRGSSS